MSYLYILIISCLCFLGFSQNSSVMSKRTVLNEVYKGLVESRSIPAEVHERDGRKYATFGSTVPIHSCTDDEVSRLSKTTHHYCDIFTEQVLAPLGELAYVRIDENTAEKVFINRSKRILILSSDGVLAQWRCAPTFESANTYIAGAPIVSASGELLSVVTAKRGNHYAVSNTEGDGGYFTTSLPWKILDTKEGGSVYGDRVFATRDELRSYIANLPPITVTPLDPPVPILHRMSVPRVVFMTSNGNQLSHMYLTGVIVNDVEYL